MSSTTPRGSGEPRSGLVLVHSSDIHVDDGYTARLFGGDGNGGLRLVLETARAHGADVALLAGDIFDHNRLPLSLLEDTTRVLAEAGMEVVLLPGNHDPLTEESVYLRSGLAEPGNVHVIGVTHEKSVHLGALDLEVWGHAHRDYNDMAPLREPHPRTTRWQVAMAHGHFEPVPDLTTRYRPAWLISAEEIAATGADYVALGHWNRFVQVGSGPVTAYYSGSPDYAQTVNVVRLGGNGSVDVARHPILGLPPME